MKLDTGIIKGLKCNVSYAVVQIPTHKDEDMWKIYDQSTEELGDVAGAAFMLFDGHGGKNAAKICCEQLLPNLVIAHKAASTNVQIASDKEPSAAEQGAKDSIKAKIMDRNSWMGYMMDSAIESCFHTTDIQAKKISDAGTTASVLLFKDDPLEGTELESPDPCVIVKCAWVGDSRCARGDLGPQGWEVCEDVSRDHRPEAQSEIARLSQSTHGRINVHQPMVVVEGPSPTLAGPNLSVRGPKGELEHISSKFEKMAKELEPHGGFQVCYDTPGFPVESSVHGTSARSSALGMRRAGSSQSMHGGAITRAGSGPAVVVRNPLPKQGLAKSKSLASVPGGNRAALGGAAGSLDEGDEAEDAKPERSGEGSERSRAEPEVVHGSTNGKEPEDSTNHTVTSENSTENAFFIGRIAHGGMMSQLRVFYPSGSSTAFTRSIGDRDTGGVNIAKPEINSIEASIQPGSRFIVASDGMWDVIKTPEAYKMVKNLSATKAASKLAQESLTKRRYAGFAPDDITVMVIDVKKQADPAAASRGVASTHGSSMEETGTGAMCGCFGGVKRSTSSPTI